MTETPQLSMPPEKAIEAAMGFIFMSDDFDEQFARLRFSVGAYAACVAREMQGLPVAEILNVSVQVGKAMVDEFTRIRAVMGGPTQGTA